MSTDLHASFIEQYVNVTRKMKNSRNTIRTDQPKIAVLPVQLNVKHQSLIFLVKRNTISVARQYMKAENKLWTLKFYSPERENSEAAIDCFIQAINKYPEKLPIRASILMELAGDLVSLVHKLKAICYYKQALEIIEQKTLSMMCLRNLLNLQIDCDNNDMALETANRMSEMENHISEKIF